MTNTWDAVIIGAGTAGLSAAQMLGRSRRRILMIDSGSPRNRFAAHMHGVLGLDGTAPAELLERGRREARGYGVEIVSGSVTALSDIGDRIRVTREDGAVDSARAVVIATGIRDELPDIPGLAQGWGRTVLHCPYCHGWEVAGQRLGVLVTSPASIHQVELVRQLSDEVTAFTAAAGPLNEETIARLTARGIRLVASPVREASGDGDDLTLTTDDGAHVVDALFVGGTPVIDLGFADDLDLAREDLPGAPLRVDLRGATSHPRVFAAGNATAPFGNVPLSMGAGSMAGAGANAMLTTEDFDRAVAERTSQRNTEWEQRYAAAEQHVWSGRVNGTVGSLVSGLEPGTALDVGSGEGGDAVWLAEHGWRATGIDVSTTAVRRATALAADHGVDARFIVADGPASIEREFDLVLASFLHSWEPDFPRIRMLREASDRVAPDGHLLIVSHAAPPPWADEAHGADDHGPIMRSPEEELALLDLDPTVWRSEIVEVRRRATIAPDGAPAHLDDGVLLLRRVR